MVSFDDKSAYYKYDRSGEAFHEWTALRAEWRTEWMMDADGGRWRGKAERLG